jgi:hypothetical protein
VPIFVANVVKLVLDVSLLRREREREREERERERERLRTKLL